MQLRQKKHKPPKAEKIKKSSGSFRASLGPLHGGLATLAFGVMLFWYFPNRVSAENQKFAATMVVFATVVVIVFTMVRRAAAIADDSSDRRGFAPLVTGIALALVGVAWGARVYVAGAYTVQTAQVLSMGALMLLLSMVTPKAVAVAPAPEVAYEEPAPVIASEPVSEPASWRDRFHSGDERDSSFTPDPEMPAFAMSSGFNPDRGLSDELFDMQGKRAHA